MNRKIGMIASAINALCVAGFALSMLLGSDYASYLTSLFIALSFVPMVCVIGYGRGGAGLCACAFGAMYALCIMLEYFAQLTTLQFSALTEQARALIDFQAFGLFFQYDLMGYALMAISTFFAGLAL